MFARYTSLLLLSAVLSTPGRAQGGCPATITDIDGNTYPVVQIGGLCWTADNLRTAHYANGDSIPTGLSDSDWEFTTSGACTVYDADPANEVIYGKLYSWFAATDPRGLCPQGWRVPGDADWKDLELALGMDATELDNIGYRGTAANVGGQLKSVTGWVAPNTGATNSSGFSALPGGYAGYDQTFEFLNTWGNFWSASDNGAGSGFGRTLASGEAGISRGQYIQQVGYSCRCAFGQPSGVEEQGAAPAPVVYPNPAAEQLYVVMQGSGVTYSLHNALGQVVISGRFNTGRNTVDLQGLPPGAYLLRTDDRAIPVRVLKQ